MSRAVRVGAKCCTTILKESLLFNKHNSSGSLIGRESIDTVPPYHNDAIDISTNSNQFLNINLLGIFNNINHIVNYFIRRKPLIIAKISVQAVLLI